MCPVDSTHLCSKRLHPTSPVLSSQASDPATSHIGCDVEHKKDNSVVTGPDSHSMIKNRFLARRRKVKEYCRKPSATIPKLYNEPVSFLTPFPYGRVEWCRNFKAASSFIYFFFSNLVKWKNPLQPPPPDLPTQCVMVRDPYSRLVSGYIDRFVTSIDFWERFGSKIVERFRSTLGATHTVTTTPPGHAARQSGEACGHDVTFPEFIKYFILSQETGWLNNWHFTPMSCHCDPCKTDYEYVAHVETMEEDLPYILNELGLEMAVRGTNRTMGVEKIPSVPVSNMKTKIRRQLEQEVNVTKCVAVCDHFKTIWWSFQTRAFVPRDSPFPLSQAQCDAYKDDRQAVASLFGDLSAKVYFKNVGKIDTKKGRRKTIVGLFLQLPLETRLKVKNLLARDFDLFGYNRQPDDLFPELVNG